MCFESEPRVSGLQWPGTGRDYPLEDKRVESTLYCGVPGEMIRRFMSTLASSCSCSYSYLLGHLRPYCSPTPPMGFPGKSLICSFSTSRPQRISLLSSVSMVETITSFWLAEALGSTKTPTSWIRRHCTKPWVKGALVGTRESETECGSTCCS